MFGKLKSGTMLTSVSSTSLPYDWDFENIFANTNHSFTSQSLSCRSLCIYPHQGIASFHPTSKDSLCGAHGRWKWKHAIVSHILQNQTMDPWRWQITQADQDRAHMWKVDGTWWKWNEILLLWISLSFIWITWGHGYIFFLSFFSWTLMCPIFFGSCFLGMSSLFLIAHASFDRF